MKIKARKLFSKILAAALIVTTVFTGNTGAAYSAGVMNIDSAGGWNETIYAQISGVNDADITGVSYTGAMTGELKGEDLEFLVRDSNGGVRIDIPGLKAGTYTLKVTTKSGSVEKRGIVVDAQDRSGYAHFNYTDGVGAYNDDGTLKSNAKVIYVTPENKNSVTVSSKDGTTVSGIGNILNSAGGKIRTDVKNPNKVLSTVINTNQDIIRKLAEDGTPLVVRIIGRIKDDGNPKDTGDKIEGLTQFDGYDYGGSVGDNGNMARMQSGKDITIEGIGYDAVIDGWGIHFIAQTAYPDFGKSFEVRNISFENVPEDCVGMEGVQSGSTLTASVERCWIHNCNFYVPKIAVPAESDKSEGDGACDFKRGQYMTNSYCYYDGYHKTNLVGSSDSSLQYNLTYHHNYWKNCESRGPLGRQANIHMYNNIFENQISYAMNTRANCYIFSEYNLFYMVKSPMSVDSGAIKSYNDSFSTCINDMGGTIVTDKNTKVNTSNKYANFDTDSSLSYIPGGKYDLQESVTEARRVIYSKTGVMKANPVSAENVTDDQISYLPDSVTPISVTTFPNKLVTSPEKLSKNVKAFTVDRNFDLTVAYASDAIASTGVLINEAGEMFHLGSGTVRDLPAGTYIIQSMNFQPGKNGASGSFKDFTINSLEIDSKETGPSQPGGHRHKYVVTESRDATCTTDGYIKKECVNNTDGNCPAPEYEEVLPAGHKYAEDWTVDVPATTEAPGSKSHHCMICGEKDPLSITEIPQIPEGGQPVVSGEYAHNFTTQGMDSSKYEIGGSLSTSKGSVIYGGESLTRCLKMETKTNISFIAPSGGELILVFGGDTSAADKKVKVNGTDYTCGKDGIAKIDIQAGRTEIKKVDAINLFYMNFLSKGNTVAYDVNVSSAGNGTASADVTKAVAGTKVNLTATPDSGYEFAEWQAYWGSSESNKLIVSADGTFQMPAYPVTVKAVFKKIGSEPETSSQTQTDDSTEGTKPSESEPGTEPASKGETIKLNASDMKLETLTADKVQSGFVVTASADNTVMIDGSKKTLDNGIIVTNRIKLGGAGTTTSRSIKVTTAGASEIEVYAMSSSSSAVRTVVLLDKDGKVVASQDNVNGSKVNTIKFSVDKAGDYYIASKASGLNVYYVTATNAIPAKEESSTEESTESTKPSQSETDSSTESTKPSQSETDASTESTKPSQSETDASTESTKPSQSETDSSTESTKPSQSETDASTESTKPSQSETQKPTDPTKPSETQTEPPHTHVFGSSWMNDESGHWKECECGEKSEAAAHTEDEGTVTVEPTKDTMGEKVFKCSTCGYVMRTVSVPPTGSLQGTLEEDVKKGEDAPDTIFSTPLDKLVDAVLEAAEKEQFETGVNVKISLIVNNADKSVSDGDKAIVIAALNGYVPGQYLDISLIANIGESRRNVTSTAEKLRITLAVPDKLKNTNSAVDRTFAVIRVHDGEAALLQDLDADNDTITIETDSFSTYVIVYKDTQKATQEPSQDPTAGNTDNGGAQTGDAAPFKLFATLAMIAGLAYLSLYFADKRRTADK